MRFAIDFVILPHEVNRVDRRDTGGAKPQLVRYDCSSLGALLKLPPI